MEIKNYEFKAKVDGLDIYEEQLLTLQPKLIGMDHQIDTYFNVPHGRLKLREGTIENALIQYDRENIADAKLSEVLLYQHSPNSTLKKILEKQLGIKIVVDKQRKIYFIDHIKFHFDSVKGLGHFLEVEAIDTVGQNSVDDLKQQCAYYFDFFQLTKNQIVDVSYSDLIMELEA